jgi:hypothetical protein
MAPHPHQWIDMQVAYPVRLLNYFSNIFQWINNVFFLITNQYKNQRKLNFSETNRATSSKLLSRTATLQLMHYKFFTSWPTTSLSKRVKMFYFLLGPIWGLVISEFWATDENNSRSDEVCFGSVHTYVRVVRFGQCKAYSFPGEFMPNRHNISFLFRSHTRLA